VEWNLLAFSIDFAAGSDEDFSVEFVGRAKNRFGAADVGLYRMYRIVCYQLDADRSSQMKNGIASLGQAFHQFCIADVPFDKIELWLLYESSNVVETAGTEIINNDNFIAVSQQALGQMGTNETCSTCN
jgi:hypothetical protein